MKKYFFGCFFIFFWLSFHQTAVASESWQELKGTHFIVYFTGEKSFAGNALDAAEKYYESIAFDLGYPRYKEFWLWENRCKIYIYPDHQAYLKATGQPEWSHGMAEYKTKKIFSYVWSQGFLDSLLPHEIAHLVFRDFVGFVGEVPLWLDEGVAQWAEINKRQRMMNMVQDLYNKDGLLSINDMMNTNLQTVKEIDRVYVRSSLTREGKPGVVFLSTNNFVNTYYIESVSLVGFLVEKYGGDAFTIFCRELRDGKKIEEALRAAYPDSLPTVKDFQEKWLKYLDETKR
jgi:hypothetical protein